MLSRRGMNQKGLRERARLFASRVVRYCRALPHDWVMREMGEQLLRSGTGVTANYRAAQRARSDKEFRSKIGLVVEECDETQLWIQLLDEANEGRPGLPDQAELLDETSQLLAIFTRSHTTAKENLERRKAERKKMRAR